jgi:MFS superfamily sulfate permease-like transporter
VPDVSLENYEGHPHVWRLRIEGPGSFEDAIILESMAWKALDRSPPWGQLVVVDFANHARVTQQVVLALKAAHDAAIRRGSMVRIVAENEELRTLLKQHSIGGPESKLHVLSCIEDALY